MISSANGGEATVRYLDDDHDAKVKHHADLPVSVGDPVRLHEQYRMLGTPHGWFCVAVESGGGPVPPPDHPDLAAGEINTAVVDLATGNALATDHAPAARR